MSYPSWTPLWSCIVESSLWDLNDAVVKIYLTMLAKRDADDIYRGTAYALGRQSRKSEAEVLEAWKILSSPDTQRLEPQPEEGRRIRAVKEGWFIINAAKYREMVQQEMKRARDRKSQAAFRDRKKGKKLPGESLHQRAMERGESESYLNKLNDPEFLKEASPPYRANGL